MSSRPRPSVLDHFNFHTPTPLAQPQSPRNVLGATPDMSSPTGPFSADSQEAMDGVLDARRPLASTGSSDNEVEEDSLPAVRGPLLPSHHRRISENLSGPGRFISIPQARAYATKRAMKNNLNPEQTLELESVAEVC